MVPELQNIVPPLSEPHTATTMHVSKKQPPTGSILLAIIVTFLILATLAYKTMEHFQEKNDQAHAFSEQDALLALPQFRLVDSTGTMFPTLLSDGTNSGMSGNYVVLAGSFTSKEKAQQHQVLLRKQGITLSDVLHFRGDQDIFAVAVGKHPTIEKAQLQVTQLRKDYRIEGYVHRIRK